MGQDVPAQNRFEHKTRDALFILAFLTLLALLGGMVFLGANTGIRQFRYLGQILLAGCILSLASYLLVDWTRYRNQNLALVADFADLNVRFGVLAETVSAVSSTLDADVLQDKILEVMLSLTHSTVGAVLLPDEAREVLAVSAQRGFLPEALRGFIVPADHGTLGKVFTSGKLAVRNNMAPDPAAATTYIDGKSPLTQVIMPLKARGEVVGVTITASTQNLAYTQDDIDLLFSLSHEMAVAIVNVELYRKSQQTLEWLEQTREYTERFIDEMLSGVMVVNERNEVVFFNKEASAVTGLRPEEVIGVNVFELEPTSERMQCLASVAAALIDSLNQDTVVKHQELRILSAYGRQLDLSYNTFPLHRPKTMEKMGGAIVFIDMTAMRDMERRLRSEDHLSLVGRMSAQLADEAKSPIIAIQGLVDQLDQSDLEPQQRHMVRLIKQEAELCDERMSGMITLVRGDSDAAENMDPEPLDEALRGLLEEFRGRRGAGDLKLVEDLAQDLPPVRASREQLRQIFLRLIDNAWQATGGAGVITVRAYPAADGFCEVRVEDSGEGIDQEVIQRVFDPFFSTIEGGTGLGLAIVRKIVRDIGGEVELVSHRETGTTVILRLPTAA
ncbi:MAG: ATP-binding protein [Candidatus Geothermincolia bacterium]